MAITWVLVAESSRAKFYTARNRSAPITEIEALAHPEGRLHEGDLVSDSAGSDGGSVGQGRHIMNDKTSAKEQEACGFAKDLANRLDSARNRGEFSKLVLVAPPFFLGLLRDNLSKEVMAMVSNQVHKNLVQKPAETVRAYL
jgi:protein required for attachment to host cells